ncbi:hypothetical protein METHP14_510028 [Pseudomonas sp. P14-2025]
MLSASTLLGSRPILAAGGVFASSSEMQAEGCDQAMSRTPSGPKMLMKPVPNRSGLQGSGRLRGRKGSHLGRHLASVNRWVAGFWARKNSDLMCCRR